MPCNCQRVIYSTHLIHTEKIIINNTNFHSDDTLQKLKTLSQRMIEWLFIYNLCLYWTYFGTSCLQQQANKSRKLARDDTDMHLIHCLHLYVYVYQLTAAADFCWNVIHHKWDQMRYSTFSNVMLFCDKHINIALQLFWLSISREWRGMTVSYNYFLHMQQNFNYSHLLYLTVIKAFLMSTTVSGKWAKTIRFADFDVTSVIS